MQELAHIQGPATPTMLVTMFTLALPFACGIRFVVFRVDHMSGKSKSACGLLQHITEQSDCIAAKQSASVWLSCFHCFGQ